MTIIPQTPLEVTDGGSIDGQIEITGGLQGPIEARVSQSGAAQYYEAEAGTAHTNDTRATAEDITDDSLRRVFGTAADSTDQDYFTFNVAAVVGYEFDTTGDYFIRGTDELHHRTGLRTRRGADDEGARGRRTTHWPCCSIPWEGVSGPRATSTRRCSRTGP